MDQFPGSPKITDPGGIRKLSVAILFKMSKISSKNIEVKIQVIIGA